MDTGEKPRVSGVSSTAATPRQSHAERPESRNFSTYPQTLPQHQTQESHPNQQQTPQHPVTPTFFSELAGSDGYPYMTLRKRITEAYKWHSYQYWFVACFSNGLLFLQILIAASLTVLGAFNDRRARTATIFLGAANTVIAGLMTYFKSRNQPNRSRQFRNDLAKIVDQLDDAEANFRNPNYHDDVFTVMQNIRHSYNEARSDAQANYPDLWVKSGSVYSPTFQPRTPVDPVRPQRHETAMPQNPASNPPTTVRPIQSPANPEPAHTR
ncbi:uncharacterized protein Z518_06801 [Rhinocladiella mackenziei CBS 650.93]|uniref:SMODS and SLOG-associating 2TM effector domain-containing protein n=1 Tax=Rhinocladiella mackenziei CBS 650.93 TaxID=1442369 RepID=A0A0D2IBQ6_9EURO|nr:uncharacterized protein Z518_06801 [Rhinocladiella mackenziei CBS 650.93]KIX03249.1 hypothetical protein Z518_06801 [Rhinocladiella mackenziei CBS 650.93]